MPRNESMVFRRSGTVPVAAPPLVLLAVLSLVNAGCGGRAAGQGDHGATETVADPGPWTPDPIAPDVSDVSDLSDLPADLGPWTPDPISSKCTVSADCAKMDDDDLCNGVPACVDGTCVLDPSSVVVCPPSEDGCSSNECQHETGLCEPLPGPNGKACSDGNPLTTVDFCFKGVCTGTGTVDCTDDADCDDLYVCTLDQCKLGKCQHLPISCFGSDPKDCQMVVCSALDGMCIEKPYDEPDNVVYEEDFEDSLAQGWTYPSAAMASVETPPSGQRGLALTMQPGSILEFAPPPVYAPPMSLLVSIGLESWSPETCASQTFTLKANGKVVAQQPLCLFLEQADGTLTWSLPKGIQGALSIGLVLENQGESTVKVAVAGFRLEGQGGISCCQDFDMDKLWACIDNCPDWHNPDQADCDFDGLGDPCDPDRDNDGVENKFDAFPCNPGAQLAVRLVTTRNIAPLEPVAVACGQPQDVCYFFELSGEHLLADLQGIPMALVRLPEIQLARSAAFCAGLLWVLDSGTSVWGYDVSDPYRPTLLHQYSLPSGLVSLEQTLACHDGDLVLSSGHILYVLEAGGTHSELYDVFEEIWAAVTTSSVYLVITRSPQPPFLFFLRAIPVGGKQQIIPLKATPDEPAPACQFAEISSAYWGADHATGALWTVVRGCLHPSLQLRDPWAALLPGTDLDGDGLDDLVDPDDDGDTVPDLDDYAPLDAYTTADADGDGRGNWEDVDDDGDGQSDNYAGFAPVSVTEECYFPGLTLTGIEATSGGYRLVAAGGSLVDSELDCSPGQAWTPPFTGLDSLACGDGDECAFHSFTNKGLFRFAGTAPLGALDSPELPSGITPLNTDLAWSDDLLFVGNDAANHVFAVDSGGNVRAEIRLPAQFAGIAVDSAGRLIVLLAVSQAESVLLRIDQAGRLLGYLPVPAGGLRSLARIDDASFVTLLAGPEGTSLVLLEFPQGLSAAEWEPAGWPVSALNPPVVLSPDVPTQTSDGGVIVTWPLEPIPDLAGLQVCWVCGAVAGFIPPQNCQPVSLTEGQTAVSGFIPGQKCAFELRATTLAAGTVSSRRVSIVVDQPGTGSIVWAKAGTMSALAWRLVAIPQLLDL